MTTSLGQKLKYLYPTAIEQVDYLAAQASNGTESIARWNTVKLGAQPSQAVLNAITDQQIADSITQDQAALIGRVTPVRLAATRTSSVIALADVVGMSFPLRANSNYIYSFTGAYTAALATTGIRLAINGPASPSLVRMLATVAESVTANRTLAASAYDTPLIGINSGGATPLPFWVEGNISTGPNAGFLTLRFGSEIAASAVDILAGSWGELKAVS